MNVRVVGVKHAECRECGALLHVPLMEASSPEMAVQGWSLRLQRGCVECGGRLAPVTLVECADCAVVARG
jgi:hypothetical protein